MEQGRRIEYVIEDTVQKSPGRHFTFHYDSPPPPAASPEDSRVRTDAFDKFNNQYSKSFYLSKEDQRQKQSS